MSCIQGLLNPADRGDSEHRPVTLPATKAVVDHLGYDDRLRASTAHFDP